MGKFKIKKTAKGVKFDLCATNGQVIASSQIYKNVANCKVGIRSVICNAPIANVEDQTAAGYEICKNPKFEIYTDNGNEIRFRLKAKNAQIVAVSEGYKSMKACVNGVESVKKNAVDAEIVME